MEIFLKLHTFNFTYKIELQTYTSIKLLHDTGVKFQACTVDTLSPYIF